MSTLLYQSLTNRRLDTAPPGPDGAGAHGSDPKAHLVDSLAALVPLEVLAAHGLILAEVSTTKKVGAGTTQTTLTEVGAAQACWWMLLVAALAFYAVPHLRMRGRRWQHSDFVRMLIPPAAFAAWTLVQRGTLFDAVRAWDSATRTIVGVLIALTLALVTKMLASRADESAPQFGTTAWRSTVEVAETA